MISRQTPPLQVVYIPWFNTWNDSLALNLICNQRYVCTLLNLYLARCRKLDWVSGFRGFFEYRGQWKCPADKVWNKNKTFLFLYWKYFSFYNWRKPNSGIEYIGNLPMSQNIWTETSQRSFGAPRWWWYCLRILLVMIIIIVRGRSEGNYY